MPDTDDTESFKAELHEPLKHYQLTGEQLSNTNQRGLHRKRLPSETLTKWGEKGHQPPVIKRRATTLVQIPAGPTDGSSLS